MNLLNVTASVNAQNTLQYFQGQVPPWGKYSPCPCLQAPMQVTLIITQKWMQP